MLRRVPLLTFSLLSLLVASPLYADSPTTHIVAWGETLYSIARAHNLSPQAIASANGLDLNSWVYAGQRLTIPSGGNSRASATPSGYYTVRAGDTLYSIAARFGVSAKSISAANNLPANGLIYVGWSLKIPSSASRRAETPNRTYIVQPGDYLVRIALQYGTTTQAIIQANNLNNAWAIYVGQRLIIPSAAPVPSPVSTSSPIRVPDIPLYRQQQTLTCEEAAVAMATRGAVSEARLVAAMPRSDNPFFGIRGRTNAPNLGGLTDYGAYAQAIQKGLSALGVKSEVLYGQTYDEFKAAILAHLKAGRPVIWWNTWRDTYQTPVTVKMSDGALVNLVPYEHAGVIVAANDKGIAYHDPYDATVQFASWADHRRVSGYFGNMALVIP